MNRMDRIKPLEFKPKALTQRRKDAKKTMKRELRDVEIT